MGRFILYYTIDNAAYKSCSLFSMFHLFVIVFLPYELHTAQLVHTHQLAFGHFMTITLYSQLD